MEFIIPLIYLLFTTGTVVLLLKEKFGKCLPVSMIISTLLLFFSQIIFKTFLVGYILCSIFALMCPLLLLYKRIKKDDLSTFKNNYLSYGFIIFILLYIIVYILNIGKEFTGADEFHYWGYNLKYMFQEDTYFKATSHLPFISTFEMLMCVLRMGYSESAATFGIQLFEFGLIIPAISDYNLKDKKINVIVKSLLMIIISLLLVFAFDCIHTSSSIYTDAFMMIYLAYLLFQTTVYDFKNKTNIIIFAISVYGFILNKQIVLALLLIPLFNLLLRFILENKKKVLNKDNIIKVIKMFLICIIVPLIIIKLFGLYVGPTEGEGGVSFITHFINIMTGKEAATYEFAAVENFLKALTNRSIFSSNTFTLSFLSLLCIIFLTMVIMNKKEKKFNNNMYISLLSSFIVGTAGYIFIFLVMYSFGGFVGNEVTRLASYERYFSTFLMGLIVCLYMIYLYLNSDKKNISYKTIFVILCIMGIFVPGDRYYCLLPGTLRNSGSEREMIAKERRISKYFSENVNDEESNVLVLSNDVEGSIYIQYYAGKFDYDYDTYSYGKNYSYEEFTDLIKEFDYIVILDKNDIIFSYLDNISDDEIVEEGIYKVDNDGLLKKV